MIYHQTDNRYIPILNFSKLPDYYIFYLHYINEFSRGCKVNFHPQILAGQ